MSQTTQTRPPQPHAAAPPAGQAPAIYRWRDAILDEARKDEVRGALPVGVTYERFELGLMNAVRANPRLMDWNINLIWREVARAVRLGLSLEPLEQESWIIVGEEKEPKLRIGWRGITKLVRQSPGVANLYPVKVHANDPITVHEGTNKRIDHTPDPFKPRGPVVGYYAVVKYINGEVDFELMSVADVEAIRDRTKNWRAFKTGATKSSPWHTDFDEMGKKTVLLRLCKRVPKSADAQQVIVADDTVALDDLKDVTPDRTAAPPPGRPGFAQTGHTQTGNPAVATPAGSVAGKDTAFSPPDGSDPATTSDSPYTLVDHVGEVVGEYATPQAWLAAAIVLLDKALDREVAAIMENNAAMAEAAAKATTDAATAHHVAATFGLKVPPAPANADRAPPAPTSAPALTDTVIPLKTGGTGHDDWTAFAESYRAAVAKADAARLAAIVDNPVNVANVKRAPIAVKNAIAHAVHDRNAALNADPEGGA